MALFLNVSTASATNINQSLTVKSHVTAVNLSVNKTTGSGINTVTIKVNNTVAKTILVNGLTVAQLKDGLNRAQAFYNKNGRLPNYVSFDARKIAIATFQKNLATQGLKIKINPVKPGQTLAQIMKGASNFGYSHRASTGADMEKIGSGDCWAMSDYLYNKMKSANIKVRIVQYRTPYSSRHRSVQIVQNNKWVDAPYRTYGINMMFNSTSSKPGAVVLKTS